MSGRQKEAVLELFQFQKWNSSACSRFHAAITGTMEAILVSIPEVEFLSLLPNLYRTILANPNGSYVSIPEVEFLSLLLKELLSMIQNIFTRVSIPEVEFLSLLPHRPRMQSTTAFCFNSRSGIPQLAPWFGQSAARAAIWVSIPEVEFLSLLPSAAGFGLNGGSGSFQFQKWNSSACSIRDFSRLCGGKCFRFQFQKWNSSACSIFQSRIRGLDFL